MDSTAKLLDATVDDCDFVATCHYIQAEGDKLARIRYGLPSAIINVVVGSVLVADLGKVVPDTMKWITALLALVSTFLVGIQTFFNFQEKERGHRELGNRFNKIGRSLSRTKAVWLDKSITDAEFTKRFEAIMEEYEKVCEANEATPPSRNVALRLKDREDRKKAEQRTGTAL
jgi:hypothetical protein